MERFFQCISPFFFLGHFELLGSIGITRRLTLFSLEFILHEKTFDTPAKNRENASAFLILGESSTTRRGIPEKSKRSKFFYNTVSGIIGKKIGMAQIFTEDGNLIPVTYVLCEPNTVHFVKEDAVVLGGEKVKKPTKTKKFKVIREFSPLAEAKKGDEVKVDIFENGEEITVVATSKGKGFTGNVKRHNFKDLRQSHGTKYGRHGSISFGRNRLRTGIKLAGKSENDQVTLRDRKVIRVDANRHLIAVLGPIPGAKNGLVLLKKQS